MPSEHDNPDRKFTALYMGVVTDNKDPEKLGRVRVRIPGVIDPASAWAFPLGLPGAGGKKRGFFAVPPEGAEVGVFFHQGDVDHPYYVGGNFGAGEVPDEVEQAATPEDATKVQAFETKRYRFLIDDRGDNAKFSMKDKKSGDTIELDGKALSIRIKSSSSLRIECDGAIVIDGSNITIGGRFVTPNGKPI